MYRTNIQGSISMVPYYYAPTIDLSGEIIWEPPVYVYERPTAPACYRPIAKHYPIPEQVSRNTPFSSTLMDAVPMPTPPTPPSLCHYTNRTHHRVHPYNPTRTPRKRYRTAQAVDTVNFTILSSSPSTSAVTSVEVRSRGYHRPQPQSQRLATSSHSLAAPETGGLGHAQRHAAEVER
ncbi:hypothetical protein CVT24_011139 [Panaeolus cyanescens]|uniref:Uncharacterized protein n=1 Tax=Panaeolus cyanescens TaxID=181874 RepID=A0A409YG69_9AGAR|nr:hypothetical protein CVT24_011139 [Panaeolus cyanescens]